MIVIIKGGKMGKAILEIETYNEGRSTRIKYTPDNINPYTIIGVLKQMIRELETQNSITEKRNTKQ